MCRKQQVSRSLEIEENNKKMGGGCSFLVWFVSLGWPVLCCLFFFSLEKYWKGTSFIFFLFFILFYFFGGHWGVKVSGVRFSPFVLVPHWTHKHHRFCSFSFFRNLLLLLFFFFCVFLWWGRFSSIFFFFFNLYWMGFFFLGLFIVCPAWPHPPHQHVLFPSSKKEKKLVVNIRLNFPPDSFFFLFFFSSNEFKKKRRENWFSNLLFDLCRWWLVREPARFWLERRAGCER